MDIEASDIDVRIGTTWIEPIDYESLSMNFLTPQDAPEQLEAVVYFWNSGTFE